MLHYHPELTFSLLLWSSPFQTILTTGTFLSFTRLAASDFAYECREQCHGNHLVTVRAFKHVGYYPKQISLCQEEIVESASLQRAGKGISS